VNVAHALWANADLYLKISVDALVYSCDSTCMLKNQLIKTHNVCATNEGINDDQ
jgi:hypothetical protein